MFVLSDKNLKFNEKTLFLFGQKWCWGLILLALFMISFCNTLLIILAPKQPTVVIYERSVWGAEPALPGLQKLSLPVDKVIVTDTRDNFETCVTMVSENSNYVCIS